ncbi:MAG: VanZ family protein [Actinomycetota bacterium]
MRGITRPGNLRRFPGWGAQPIAIILWTLTILWGGVIFYFSSLAGSQIPSVMPDFIPHFIEYFIFAALTAAAVWSTKKELPAGRLGLWAITITAIYAASDEFHQAFVPGRTPDGKDWAVDVAGAIAVAGIIYLVRVLRSRR